MKFELGVFLSSLLRRHVAHSKALHFKCFKAMLHSMLAEETADRNALLLARRLLTYEIVALDATVDNQGPRYASLCQATAVLRSDLAEACHMNRQRDAMICLLSHELQDAENDAAQAEEGMRRTMGTLKSNFEASSSRLSGSRALPAAGKALQCRRRERRRLPSRRRSHRRHPCHRPWRGCVCCRCGRHYCHHHRRRRHRHHRFSHT